MKGNKQWHSHIRQWHVTTSTFVGVVRSGLEAGVAMALDTLGYPVRYEEVSIPYQVTMSRTYTPDFTFSKTDGGIMHIEVKGRFTAADRRKMEWVKKAHPDADIRMLFQYGNTKISKTSKTTYASWCDRRGIPWAETRGAKALRMPVEWLFECRGIEDE